MGRKPTDRLAVHVLVIGIASIDQLHFSGRSAYSGGGAGMYTAAAAHRLGADVALFAPRPHPMPPLLQPADERLYWLGPEVPTDRLTSFEITYHGEGAPTLEAIEWGAESDLLASELPCDLSGCTLVHLAALSSARRQLQFFNACRKRGAPLISVGTDSNQVHSETGIVHAPLQQADIFFMNDYEASGLFKKKDRLHMQAG